MCVCVCVMYLELNNDRVLPPLEVEREPANGHAEGITDKAT